MKTSLQKYQQNRNQLDEDSFELPQQDNIQLQEDSFLPPISGTGVSPRNESTLERPGLYFGGISELQASPSGVRINSDLGRPFMNRKNPQTVRNSSSLGVNLKGVGSKLENERK